MRSLLRRQALALLGAALLILSGAVTVGADGPAIHLELAASADELPRGGGFVTYTYSVTNPGSVALSRVRVVDDRCPTVRYRSGDTNRNGRLESNERWRYACGGILRLTTTNRAIATATAGSATVHDRDVDTVVIRSRTPAIHVVVVATPDSLQAGGGRVTMTYLVMNTGSTPLTGIVVIGSRCPTISHLGGDRNGNGRLDLRETWQYRCVTSFARSTVAAAVARGIVGSIRVADTDRTAVTVAGPSPSAAPRPGGTAVASATASAASTTAPTPSVGPASVPPSVTAQPTSSLGPSPSASAPPTPSATGALSTTWPEWSASPSPTPGTSGSSAEPSDAGRSGTPEGDVAGVTSPPKPSANPGDEALNTGTTPSGIVTILVVVLGLGGSVVIRTLARRPS